MILMSKTFLPENNSPRQTAINAVRPITLDARMQCMHLTQPVEDLCYRSMKSHFFPFVLNEVQTKFVQSVIKREKGVVPGKGGGGGGGRCCPEFLQCEVCSLAHEGIRTGLRSITLSHTSREGDSPSPFADGA